MFTRLCDLLGNIILKLIMLVMALLVVGTVWQVFSRFVLNNPSTFTEEVMRFSLIWIGFLGSSYAFYKRDHMALTILPNKLKGIYKFALDFAINMCVMVMSFSVITYGGLRMMSVSAAQTSAILKLSMPMVYSVLPISGVATMVFTLKLITDDIFRFAGEDAEHAVARAAGKRAQA